MDGPERNIDDLIAPRKKTITDLWREKEERHMPEPVSKRSPSFPFSDSSDFW